MKVILFPMIIGPFASTSNYLCLIKKLWSTWQSKVTYLSHSLLIYIYIFFSINFPLAIVADQVRYAAYFNFHVFMHADAKGAEKYFDKLRTEHGFAELLSLDKFYDPNHGYLVNDCCVFGVEVLVIQPSTSSKETITMVKEFDVRKHTWSIKDFSKINEISRFSDEFTVGGRKWFTYISHFSCTINVYLQFIYIYVN